ncbi:MAG: hypothetical protein K9H58_16280 [Bacteroidales bacterium]|nr:hypothetical protein [Bacteroidales bacterium]
MSRNYKFRDQEKPLKGLSLAGFKRAVARKNAGRGLAKWGDRIVFS